MEQTIPARVILIEGEVSLTCGPPISLGLAQAIRSAGGDALVLCSASPVAAELEKGGVRSLLAPGRLPGALGWRSSPLLRELCEFRPDLLHALNHQQASAASSLASQLRCPYVLTVTHSPVRTRRLPMHRVWLSQIIAAHDSLREELVNTFRVPKEKVRVIPQGVDTPLFRPLIPAPPSGDLTGSGDAASGARNAFLGHRSPVVGMLAPMVKQEGHDILLRAAKDVLDRHADVHFLLAGKGPEGERLRRLASQLGVSAQVTFAEYVESHIHLLKAMDILVSLAPEDTAIVTVLEAMASGRPVIASGVGGLYSIVRDGETGIIVPSRDSATVAQSILGLLDRPEIAFDMAQRALALVEAEYDQKALSRRILTVYGEAIASCQDTEGSRMP